MVAGDGELIGEEAVNKEVLVPESRPVGSSLERVLDVAVETTILRGGSDGNRGGWWCCLAACRGRRVTT
jgi:hypothetical protein